MDSKKKTLLLINPANKSGSGFIVNKDTRYQPLSLGIIAALTPSDWKVKIIDENFRDFRYYEADFVGFTAFSSTVSRAYELAQIYRERGIKTVIGGIHVSMCPDEASKYVDSVVIGEAESVWPQVIRDFEAGTLRPVYKGILTDLIRSPRPRRDLFHPAYIFASIQTTRGCPMNCDFCSVTAFNGSHYRYRPIDEVIDEMAEIPQKNIFILDDNIVGNNAKAQARAIELFRAMIDRGIRKDWIGQASLNVADNEDVLKYAAKSGCRMLFIGIESEQEDQLSGANKRLNLRMGVNSYDHVFDKMHKYGIAVIAGFIFGWENDTPERIDHRVAFTRRCHADSIQTTLLTPLPGTRLFERMQREGMLVLNNFPDDWKHYGYESLVFKPATMDRIEMQKYIFKAFDTVYEPGFLKRRMLKSWWRTGSFITAYWSYMSNWNYRSMAFGNIRRPKNWLMD
ncbi:MAG: B12-binding domain-containing radical SAM protein [Alphaproteobacteria bacterium]|nr:B12-binding domain-containing radical SAM protein [Alphaproteobacteria bacterium]